MSKKIIGIFLVIGGVVLSCASLFADYFGLGDIDPDHFVIGSKQIAGMVIGVMVTLTGIFYLRKGFY